MYEFRSVTHLRNREAVSVLHLRSDLRFSYYCMCVTMMSSLLAMVCWQCLWLWPLASIYLFVALLSLIAPATAADVWISLNESENYVARHECSFLQAGNRFYLFGGRENATRLERYNYVTNTWDTGATVPAELNHFQAVNYQGLIWVAGAFADNNYPKETPANYSYIYDPSQNVWMTGPLVPQSRRRGGAGLVVYNHQFYLVGGSTRGHKGGTVAWFDRYDPRTGLWVALANAPSPRDHFAAVVVGRKLYCIGGRFTDPPNVFDNTTANIDVYDFSTSRWSTIPGVRLTAPRAGASAVYFNGKILLIGGESNTLNAAWDRVDAFDPVTQTLTQVASLKNRRQGTQAFVSGSGVITTAGSPNRGGGNQRNMEVYSAFAPVGVAPTAGLLLSGTTTSVPVWRNQLSNVTIAHSSGNTGVIVISAALQGINAAEFNLVAAPRVPFLIGQGESRQITVTYTGTSGSATAALIIAYSGASTLHVPLQGLNASQPSPTALSNSYACFPPGLNGTKALRTAITDYAGGGTTAKLLYGPVIGDWCVDNITSFNGVFQGMTNFNEPLTNWRTSKATSMAQMFQNCFSFNRPLGHFDVSRVTNMDRMFLRAYAFTGQGLATWNVSSVQSLYWTFKNCSAFNQPVSNWDVRSVTDLSETFRFSVLKQNLCPWGLKLSLSKVGTRVLNTFDGTKCPVKTNLNFAASPPGPLCFACTNVPPTAKPTKAPTKRPTSPAPTRSPTRKPTRAPTRAPTRMPTREPSRRPTRAPTRRPTAAPIAAPTPVSRFGTTCFPADGVALRQSRNVS